MSGPNTGTDPNTPRRGHDNALSASLPDQEHNETFRAPETGHSRSRRWLVPALLSAATGLGAAALYNVRQTRATERRYPPIGHFLDVDGVRLHYIERGQGDPLVLIHGNGTMIQDFTVSGLIDRLVGRYRVIVIDRPGYGYSSRPRQLWTPRAQARLFQRALVQLGVEQTVVYGHSWGTLVALALAMEFPSLVRGLVLGSGYYYPTLRADTFLLSPPAIPVIGDGMRYTISPLIARAILPGMIRRMFQPAAVPARFDRLFPKALMLRPSQLRAAAEDAALMTPSVMELKKHYRELMMPVAIVAGTDDQIVDVGRQSERLHGELPDGELILLPGLGHMVHHMDPDAVAKAIDHTVQLSGRAPVF
ncbi:alpha/beta fold hydrolase [Microvirga sp. 2MCAF35]|uniref:alpha/beta fold hydrolase n=1 Tax=Microvirga sp. 2MCAF35 TaxID=3232987 RepID=UPI003F9A7C71